MIVARTADSHELLALLREHQPTVLSMLPAALIALVRDHDLQPHDFASLRVCRSAADKASTELLTEFAAAAGFPITEAVRDDRGRDGHPESSIERQQTGIDRPAGLRLQHLHPR